MGCLVSPDPAANGRPPRFVSVTQQRQCYPTKQKSGKLPIVSMVYLQDRHCHYHRTSQFSRSFSRDGDPEASDSAVTLRMRGQDPAFPIRFCLPFTRHFGKAAGPLETFSSRELPRLPMLARLYFSISLFTQQLGTWGDTWTRIHPWARQAVQAAGLTSPRPAMVSPRKGGIYPKVGVGTP